MAKYRTRAEYLDRNGFCWWVRNTKQDKNKGSLEEWLNRYLKYKELKCTKA